MINQRTFAGISKRSNYFLLKNVSTRPCPTCQLTSLFSSYITVVSQEFQKDPKQIRPWKPMLISDDLISSRKKWFENVRPWNQNRLVCSHDWKDLKQIWKTSSFIETDSIVGSYKIKWSKFGSVDLAVAGFFVFQCLAVPDFSTNCWNSWHFSMFIWSFVSLITPLTQTCKRSRRLDN